MEMAKQFPKALALAAFFFIMAGLAVWPLRAQTIINANWPTGVANWTTPSDWDCPSSAVHCVPNNSSGASYNATISGGGSSTIFLDSFNTPSSITINTLSVGAFAGLATLNGGSLSTKGGVTNDGSIGVEGSPSTPCSSTHECFLPASLSVGADLTNTGSIDLLSNFDGGTASLSVAGNLTNTGSIGLAKESSGQTVTLSVAGNLTNSGSFGLGGFGSASAKVTASGNLANTGNLLIGTGGLMKIDGGYAQTAGSTDADGTLMAPTVDIAGGKLFGSGTVTGNVVNSAVTSPDDPSGNTLTISGNYTQKADGTLLIDISGPKDFSILDVTGEALLDGTAEFDFLNGYVPGPNTSFAFLEAGSVVGDFTSLSFINPPFNNLRCPTCTFNPKTLSLDTGSTPPTTSEPGTLLLFGTGFFASFWLLRKKAAVSRS
jgi:hypothetical protein